MSDVPDSDPVLEGPDGPTTKSADPDGQTAPAADEAMTESEKRLLMVLGAGALVVLLVILAVNIFSGDDDADANSGTSETTAAAGEQQANSDAYGSSANAFGTDGGIVETPADLAPVSESLSDKFDRTELKGGPLTWSIVGQGDWGVSSGLLTVGAEPKSVSPKAVVEVPDSFEADWDFSVTLAQRANNVGLVWGIEDDQNYWEMRANLDFAAIVISHVKDGSAEQVRVIGPAGVGEGQRLSIQHQGDTVTLAGDGNAFISMSDPSLAEPRKVGVIASSGSDVSFSDVAVSKIDASD